MNDRRVGKPTLSSYIRLLLVEKFRCIRGWDAHEKNRYDPVIAVSLGA